MAILQATKRLYVFKVYALMWGVMQMQHKAALT